jgi:transposase
MEFKRISIDTSKHIFMLHGVDDQDRVTLRRELRRGQVEAFFAKLPSVEIALEACAGAHHWGRVLGAFGHRVKLIPPQYMKPFVKRARMIAMTRGRSARRHPVRACAQCR